MGDTLFFPHKELVSENQGYWLCSPSAYTNEYVMMISYKNGEVGYNSYDSQKAGVRPAIWLPYDTVATSETSEGEKIWTIDSN